MANSPALAERVERMKARVKADLHSAGGGYDTIDFQPHAGQRLLLDSTARFRVLVAHRRWGKNWACIWDAWEQLRILRQEERPLLSPKVVVWFVFPTYPLAEELWNDWKRFVPAAEVTRKLEQKPYHMELKGDVHISLRTAEDPDSLVSAGVDLLYMVEAARMKKAAWLTVQPTLISQGRLGRVVFNSTPKGMGWLHEIDRIAHDPLYPDWEGWRIPAFAADGVTRNPYSVIPSTERLLEERQQYPERWWRQEFMAEFLSGEGAVFRNIRERMAAAPIPPKHPLVCGVDLAKHSDFTVFAVFDADGRMVEIERLREASYPIQVERLLSLLNRLQLAKCVIESNGPGEPFYDMVVTELHTRRQEFQRQPQVIPFATTAQSKRQMVDALVIAFEQGKITILPDEELANEFEAFEMTAGAAGNVRFAAPEGGWDDRVMACALAWTEITKAAPKVFAKGTFPRGLQDALPRRAPSLGSEIIGQRDPFM